MPGRKEVLKKAAEFFWLEGGQDEVGQGTFGQVHRGRNTETGAFVAVKTCYDDGDYSQHESEITLLEKLNSPFIVKFIAAKEVDGSTGRKALIMEMADGSLRSELRRPENYFGLPYKTLFRIISHIESGLSYLNSKNVAHRDIKPDNILIFRGQSETFYKLCDFGCSREVETADQSLYSIVGTPGYLNEQTAESAAKHGMRGKPVKYTKDVCDLWSFGCVVFECATGRLPFYPEKGITDLIGMHNMMSKRPYDAICGEVRNGIPHWSEKLPKDRCSYPKSLQRILCDFIRRLFDKRASTRLTFDKFSEMCAELTSLKTFRLFNINKLSLEDYFDTSSAACFQRFHFEEDILDDLPEHNVAQLLSLPSGAALSLVPQMTGDDIHKESAVAVIACKTQDGDSFTIPIIDPPLTTSSIPTFEQIANNDYILLRSVANVLRLEKQIEAMWAFVEGCSSFLCTFYELLSKNIDSLVAEVSSTQRTAEAVRLQSTALGLGKSANEKDAIENNSQQIATEMNRIERETKELKDQMAKMKEEIQQLAAIEIPKFISQKEVLETAIEARKSQPIDPKLLTERDKEQIKADCHLVRQSVENTILKRNSNCDTVRGTVAKSIAVISGNLFDISHKFNALKTGLNEATQLIFVAGETNKKRIEEWQGDREGDGDVLSKKQYLEIMDLLKKVEEEAKACREEAEKTYEGTKGLFPVELQ